MKYDVFVSYSSKNKPAAVAVTRSLERSGLRCWVAPRDILPGEKWAEGILRGINSSRAMVVLFSSHANASEHIQREIERAVHRSIPIVPVRIENAMPSGSLEYFLSACHWLDAFAPPLEAHLEKLTQRMQRLLQIQPTNTRAAAAPPTAPPPAFPAAVPATIQPPTSKAKRRPIALVASLAICALGAGIFLSTYWSGANSHNDHLAVAPLSHPSESSELAAANPTPAAYREISSLARPPTTVPDDSQLLAVSVASSSTASLSTLSAAPTSRPDTDELTDSTTPSQFATLIQKTIDRLRARIDVDGPFTPELYEKLVDLLKRADVKQSKDRDLLTTSKQFADGLVNVDLFTGYLNDLIEAPQRDADAEKSAEEKVAQDRAVAIQQLMSIATADDNREKGHDALAALDELLKLDPTNEPAISLRATIDEYYHPSKLGDIWLNTVAMNFVYIPEGDFTMGSLADEPGRSEDEMRHRVSLTKPFLIGQTLVTVAQFSQFVADTGYKTDAEIQGWAYEANAAQWIRKQGASWHNPSFAQGKDHPVVYVSWNDAMKFCDWLSHKEGLNYRLPTEAEWECACRAGTQTAYPWGDNPNDGQGWANCADLDLLATHPAREFTPFNWSDGYVYTSPVGKFRPNAFGLYDMIGDALEWCSDWYGDYGGDAVDPQGPAKGEGRVARGGCWERGPDLCRSACRANFPPGYCLNITGFRVVRDVP